jgi:hypothetical protein
MILPAKAAQPSSFAGDFSEANSALHARYAVAQDLLVLTGEAFSSN